MARGRLHQARTTETFWQQTLWETLWMQGERSSFQGIWTDDDDPLERIDSLMKGRPSSLLFKPPFDNHGAARLRSEELPPWLLLAQWHEMIQSIRESAGVSLDAVERG
jgi:hypothetical protein